MKPQSPSEHKLMVEDDPIFGNHGPWANGWHPAWDSARDKSNSGRDVQVNTPDDSSATKSPRTSSTPPEEQLD